MIVDVSAFVGRWPFRRLRHAGVQGIRALMDRTGTQIALTTPLHAVFYRDCLEAVVEMCEEVRPCAGLHPVAVVNPAFPGWERDLGVMVEDFGCVALRLFPSYHQYRLHHDSALALLEEGHRRGLPLLLNVRLEHEPWQHPLMPVPPVPLDEVSLLLRSQREGSIILCGLNPVEVRALARDIIERPQTYVDFSWRPAGFYLASLIELLGVQHLIYGSAMPLQYPESALLQVHQARIGDEAKQRVLSGNAADVWGWTLRGP